MAKKFLDSPGLTYVFSKIRALVSASTETEASRAKAAEAELESAIGTKASASAVTSLTNRVSTAEGEIDTLQTDVGKKASTSSVTALTTRVSTAENEIDTLQSDVSDLSSQLETTESNTLNAIEQINANIDEKAFASDVANLTTRVSTAEGDINNLEATRATVQSVTDVNTRVNTAESDIDTLQSGKADKNLSNVTAANFKEKVDTTNIVTTAGTGAAYTASVPGITSLKAGVTFTMVPHTASTTASPTLNVNSLGAKPLRMPLTNNTSGTTTAATTSWLTSGKPVVVLYDGETWKTISMPKTSLANAYGTLPVANGGTGKTTVTANSFLVGNGTSALAEKTAAQAWALLKGSALTTSTTSTTEGSYALDAGAAATKFLNIAAQLTNLEDALNGFAYVDASGSSYNMDTLLKQGAHFKIYKTNSTTVNTPYNKGVVNLQGSIILSYATSANYGTQLCMPSGGENLYLRKMTSGTIGDWRKIESLAI